MDISFKRLHPLAQLPQYQTPGSAAMDVAACLESSVTLAPRERRVIPTGFAMRIPQGYEAQLRARSGMSLKYGIGLANGVGTIDSDYRGEVGVILLNHSEEPFVVEPGMRIAQMVIARYEHISWREVEELDQTERGEGGYGSSGQ